MTGKALRLRRLVHPGSGRVFAVPMDHGLSTWPIEGLQDVAGAVARVVQPGVTAVVVHKGLAAQAAIALAQAPGVGLIVHLSGATSLGPDPQDKRLVGSVRHAVSLGADAVSVQVNLGVREESAMLERLGRVAESCDRWGMPLLAMMYVQAPERRGWQPIAHAARAAAELGADIVKSVYTGSPETFRHVIDSVPVPVVIGGGPAMDSDAELLQMIEGALDAGAGGICIGRNLFNRPPHDPVLTAIAGLLHDSVPAMAGGGTASRTGGLR